MCIRDRGQQSPTQALSDSLVEELLNQQISSAAMAAGEQPSAERLAVPPAAVQPELAIRVMLHNGPGPVFVRSGTGTETLGCQGSQLMADSPASGPQRWFQATPGRSIGLDQQRYRGDLQVLCQGNRVTVVNHLPLEDYISSVVGACLLYTSPSPRDATLSRMPSSA